MYLKVRPNKNDLDRVERLALAHIRLSCYEWDEIVGPKPHGFDNLPKYAKPHWLTRKRKLSRSDYVRPAMTAIETVIGAANISRVWWKYGLGRSEEEWFQWYCSAECLLTNQISEPLKEILQWLRQK